jgi:MFS family permease
MLDPDAQTAPEQGLRWPARIPVLAVAIGAIVVGAASGFALLQAIPYGGVGALLAIRRPRTSIGWLLLLMAWLHALAAVPVDGTLAQFVAGPPLPLAVAAVATGSVGVALFAAYALIAMIFPSGRLPGGRWGRVARVAAGYLAAVVVIALLWPEITVNLPGYPNGALVPNPVGLAPDSPVWHLVPRDLLFGLLILIMAAAALSLFIRLRRAQGVERQQLRWITAAALLVVGSVLTGLTLGALLPGAADAGLIWIPAILAFSTVPVAIGIAVLRYRLYDIDTIVNRAIVYGLLTAILAGASAAAIGVLERVFEGVIGPGSDVSIILTTLLVVTAFTPVKDRLQKLVDRRIREVRDPIADLAAFEAEIRGGIARPDQERVMRRLVEVVLSALAATGVALVVRGPAATARSVAVGKPDADEPFVVRGAAAGAEAELTMTGVSAPRAVGALRSALIVALEETAPD